MSPNERLNNIILAGLLVGRGKKSQISRDFRGQIRGKNGRFRGNFAGIFEASFAENTIGKERPIAWEFPEQISLESDWFCADLTKVFNETRCSVRLIDLLRLHTAIWKRTSFTSKQIKESGYYKHIYYSSCFVEYLLYSISRCLPHLRNFVYDDSSFFPTSEAHFSALEFGFQVSSHSVFVVRTCNGLFVYLVKTSMNFAHFAGFHGLSFVDRINRSEKDRIRRNPAQDAAQEDKTSRRTLIPSFHGLR